MNVSAADAACSAKTRVAMSGRIVRLPEDAAHERLDRHQQGELAEIRAHAEPGRGQRETVLHRDLARRHRASW